MYAVVDIETTGGNPIYHDITEIAIIIMDKNRVIDEYTTLVRPKQLIPAFITSLTGITNEMVRDAPTFEEIADTVDKMLSDNIFVAHNVNFDYGFIKKQFAELQRPFNHKKLCTVRLSRKLITGLNKYSLGNICTYLGISNEARHRAFGDAKATAILLKELIRRDSNGTILKNSLNRKKSFLLPPNVPESTFEKLPSAIGVYYFHDNKGDIIYIGKAKDIKQRVKSHFSGNTHSKKKTLFRTKIHDVTFDKTGSELLAFLLEDQKIKKHYPYFNRTNKKFILNQGLYQYHDQEGYIRLAIGPVGKHNHPVRSFASKGEALQFLLSKSLHAGLCMKLNGIIKNRDCNYTSSTKQKCPICEGNISKEGYNLKVKEALKNTENQETYLVKTKGRSIDEFGIVMIEKGRCLGIGYINANNVSSLDWDSAKENLTPYYDTKDTQAILTQHLKKARVTSHGEYMVYSV